MPLAGGGVPYAVVEGELALLECYYCKMLQHTVLHSTNDVEGGFSGTRNKRDTVNHCK